MYNQLINFWIELLGFVLYNVKTCICISQEINSFMVITNNT